MEISKAMTKAFNDQIQAEFQSAHLYLSMAAWFEANDYPGCAHWMRHQFAEETEHGMKMFKFICERGGRAELQAIEAPKKEWGSVKDAFAETLDHEREVTKLIYALMDKALNEKDYASAEFLNWYVKEQVEEEAAASEILSMLRKIGDNSIGLAQLDKQLAAR